MKTNQEIIAKAEEIINSKTGYIGGGMEGYATLSLIDENGYPTASTLTIAKADGIKWLTFCTSLSRNSVKRIKNCNRASVCLNSSEYNINLVGTIEVLTDPDTKKDNWFPIMNDGSHWSGPDDPEFCVLRFTTERYTLFVDYEEVKGTL
jgi:general stress protein 26